MNKLDSIFLMNNTPKIIWIPKIHYLFLKVLQLVNFIPNNKKVTK